MDIKAATKFLKNSEFKQLCHISSELVEVWMAWAKYKIFGWMHEEAFAIELLDLQTSVQTMLKGAMDYADWYIDSLRTKVYKKNNDRGYYKR